MPEEKDLNATEEMLLTSSSQEQVMKALQRFYRKNTKKTLDFNQEMNWIFLSYL